MNDAKPLAKMYHCCNFRLDLHSWKDCILCVCVCVSVLMARDVFLWVYFALLLATCPMDTHASNAKFVINCSEWNYTFCPLFFFSYFDIWSVHFDSMGDDPRKIVDKMWTQANFEFFGYNIVIMAMNWNLQSKKANGGNIQDINEFNQTLPWQACILIKFQRPITLHYLLVLQFFFLHFIRCVVFVC